MWIVRELCRVICVITDIRETFLVMYANMGYQRSFLCANVDRQRNYMVMCADVAHRNRVYGDIC